MLTNLTDKHKSSQICIADHQGLISTVKLTGKKNKKQTYQYREMKENNWKKFTDEVDKLRVTGNSINEKWTNLITDIKNAVETLFPTKYIEHKELHFHNVQRTTKVN